MKAAWKDSTAHYTEIHAGDRLPGYRPDQNRESDCLKELGVSFFLFSLPRKETKRKEGGGREGGERLDAVKGQILSHINQAGKNQTCSCQSGHKDKEERLDAVKRLAVACIAGALGRAALLAGRPCSHVRAGERLQLVQLLGQFAQHAGAEVGAALG